MRNLTAVFDRAQISLAEQMYKKANLGIKKFYPGAGEQLEYFHEILEASRFGVVMETVYYAAVHDLP